MPFYNPYKTHHGASAPSLQQQQQQQQQYPPQQRYHSEPQQPQYQDQHHPQHQYQQQQQYNPQFHPQRQPPQQQQQQQYYPQQQQQYQQPTQPPPQPTGSPTPPAAGAAAAGPTTQVKAGIWAKFKNQITVATASGETDGLTADDTVVTNALVKFYTEQKPGAILPGWLRGGSNGNEVQNYTAPSPLAGKSTNSLQEIYNRRSNNTTPVQSQQQQQQQQANGGSVPSWRVQQHPTGSNTGSISSASAERYKSKLRSAQRPSMDSNGSYSGSSLQQGQQQPSRPSWSSKASWS
ncbi:hypothetical protein D0Z03_002806 [Geotrichum reessii]|nr:hypothetical protein D0Z03_002806 [Galactomyces reessii]